MILTSTRNPVQLLIQLGLILLEAGLREPETGCLPAAEAIRIHPLQRALMARSLKRGLKLKSVANNRLLCTQLKGFIGLLDPAADPKGADVVCLRSMLEEKQARESMRRRSARN